MLSLTFLHLFLGQNVQTDQLGRKQRTCRKVSTRLVDLLCSRGHTFLFFLVRPSRCEQSEQRAFYTCIWVIQVNMPLVQMESTRLRSLEPALRLQPQLHLDLEKWRTVSKQAFPNCMLKSSTMFNTTVSLTHLSAWEDPNIVMLLQLRRNFLPFSCCTLITTCKQYPWSLLY